MLPSTRTAITAILRADPSIGADDFNRIKAAFDGGADRPGGKADRPLYKRSDLIRLTGLTGVSIDRYARKGFLVRVHLGGSSRATGFTPESVDAFLAGRTGATTDATPEGGAA